MKSRPSSHRHPAGMRGFTLVELMVVIVILGGLIALVGPRVWTALTEASRGTAEQQMYNFDQTIQMYLAKNKKLPQNLEELTQEDPQTGEAYLDSIPKDPWGQAYVYKLLGKSKFQIVSFGPDQQEGTNDDVVWPKVDQEN